jgi:hypothetical protein
MTSPIALVLDQNFGTRVLELAKQMPVWIVESEENDSAVKQTRSALGGMAHITSLLLGKGESASDACLRALYEIDEHHGPSSLDAPYDRVLVFGCVPHLITSEVMNDLGFARVSKTDSGFYAEKQGQEADPPGLSHTK